jgi:hypothetical protein
MRDAIHDTPIHEIPEAAALSQHWQEYGYIVVRRLFSAKRATDLAAVCEKALKQWRLKNPETGGPGGGPEATVMRHLVHTGYWDADDTGDRLALLAAVADPKVLAVCRAVLGQEPLFRATSLFMNPLKNSRAGNWHRDSQFHWPDEAEEKRMLMTSSRLSAALQLQVALEPSADVEVVPGSHQRWDNPAEYAIRRADDGKNNRSPAMPGAVRLKLEAGDALAFNPCALHRGRYHTNKRRRTFMLTYTGESAPHFDYFSDQPWFLEAGYLDGLEDEARAFFDRFIDQYKKDWLQPHKKKA